MLLQYVNFMLESIRIDQLRPPKSKPQGISRFRNSLPMSFEMGQALTRILIGKLLTSIVRVHPSPAIESLLECRQIGQCLNSQGDVRVMVTSKTHVHNWSAGQSPF